MSRTAFLLALCGALLSTSTAAAQGWLADRGRAQGPGFRLGNLELHPGLGVEGGYDSNLFYEDGAQDSAGLLRVTGHLLLSTLGAQRQEDGETEGDSAPMVRFTAGISGSYYHFFNDRVSDNVSVDANFDLTINPQGRFSFRLYDTLGRSIRPFTDANPEGQAPLYARIQNSGGADLTIQTRGQTLAATFGYRIDLDYFEDANFDYLNNLTHVVSAAVNWRFLPNTALVHRTEAMFQNYFEGSPSVGTQTSDSRRVNSWLGVNGALTSSLAFTAMAGYAVGFYERADDFDGFLAHLELKYQPRQSLSFALGYRRSFLPSFIGNFTRSNRIYLRSQLMLGGSFLLGANLAVSFDKSGDALTPDGMGMLGNQRFRTDTRLFATLFGEYRFTDWLAVNASIGYAGDFTDFTFADPMTGTYPDGPAGYNKFDIWGGVRVFY